MSHFSFSQSYPLRTSESDPIDVDFLPQAVLHRPGRLGITLAPGKCNMGMSGQWARDLDVDLQRIRTVFAVDVLVSLIERHEFAELQVEHLLERVEALGMRSRWFPIPDFHAPPSKAALHTLITEILADLTQGNTVVIHCKAGLGRSGLVVACCLVALGYGSQAAIAQVRQVRPGAVENHTQETFIAEFAEFLAASA